MDEQQLYRLIKNEDKIESFRQQGLKEIVDTYPYFQAGIFAYLKSLYLHDNDSFRKGLNGYSIFVNDRKALFYYILSEEYERFFSKTEKKELSKDKTDVLLNAFFETHESQDVLELEYNLTHTTLASSDYFSYVENIEKEEITEIGVEQGLSNAKHQVIIDSFIEKANEEGGISINIDKSKLTDPEVLPVENEGDDVMDDDLFFTETLSKIYIKQKKYEKAYKIIKHLSLNYPKKNIYFADQLSFLEKLIINLKYKEKK